MSDTSGTPAWAQGAGGTAQGAGGTPTTPSGPGDPAAGTPGTPGTVPGTTPDEAQAGSSDGSSGGGRPAWLLPVAIGVGVLVVVGIVIAIVTSGGGDDAAATPTVTPTVVLPVPTPTVAPEQRADPTDFTKLLPATILQYAFQSEKKADALLQAGAVEAVTDTYTDGGTGTLTVDAAQFETADAAAAAAKEAAGATKVEPTSPAAGLPQQGDVTAGGQKVGTYAIVDAGEGKGLAIWTNGTAMFRMSAPVGDIVAAYSSYPM